MKNFARKAALVFALCLACVSFAAAKGKGSAAMKVVGKVSVSKTASADSSTKTVDLLNGFTVSMAPAFDVGSVDFIYVKFDCTNGYDGKTVKIYVNDKKLDDSFVYGEWWKIPSKKKNGVVSISANRFYVEIQ